MACKTHATLAGSDGCSRSVPKPKLANGLLVKQLSTQLFAYTTAALQDKRHILEGCSRIVPSLRDAEVVADWAGLRPYRQRVRIELEHKQVFPAFVSPETPQFGFDGLQHGLDEMFSSWLSSAGFASPCSKFPETDC